MALPAAAAAAASSLRVVCGTWNVNGQVPIEDLLTTWICPSTSSSPHIVAISLQEVVDLKALKNYVNEDQSKSRLQLWCDTVIQALQTVYRHQFCTLAQEQMVGTCILVICQVQLAPLVRHVSAAHVATGKFGVMGNKGGCAIRFSFMDRFTFCFLGLHLSAHQDQAQRRTLDWENVLGKLCFAPARKRTSMEVAIQNTLQQQEHAGGGDGEMKVLDHDLIFAMGDFNYRLDLDNATCAQVVQHVDRKEYSLLLSRDQLLNEMRHGTAFEGFKEALPITFPPTFKFRVGTTSTYVEKRIPAWCDRVLLNANPHLRTISSLRCQDYRSCSSITSSDHKPVVAEFDITLAADAAAGTGERPLRHNTRSRSVIFFPEIDQGSLLPSTGAEEEGEEGAVEPFESIDFWTPISIASQKVVNPVDYQPMHGLGERTTSFTPSGYVLRDDEEDDDDDDDDSSDGQAGKTDKRRHSAQAVVSVMGGSEDDLLVIPPLEEEEDVAAKPQLALPVRSKSTTSLLRRSDLRKSGGGLSGADPISSKRVVYE